MHPPVPGLSFPTSDNPTWPGYPPPWPLFLALIYKIYVATGIHNRFFYYFLIKQPMIIADLFDACLIFKLVNSHAGSASAQKAFAFWLLCPYTLLISSIWGMFDQITLFFVLLALYLLTNPWKSSFLESIGIALKLLPSIYLPLFASMQSSWKKTILYTVLCVSLSASFSLFPYVIFRSWNLSALTSVGIDVTNKFANTMNYWEILNTYWVYYGYSTPSNTILVIRIIGLIWIPIVFLATFFCVRSIYRGIDGKILQERVILSLIFVTLAFYLSKSVITEQFVIYFLGFGLFDYYVLPNKVRRKLFHCIWITAFATITFNSVFLLRFFEPISTFYAIQASYFMSGPFGLIRLILMTFTAVLFSIFSFLYLRSLYTELKMMKKQSNRSEQLISKT